VKPALSSITTDVVFPVNQQEIKKLPIPTEETGKMKIMNHNVLLVEPEFPYPAKSKHRANEIHKNFVPIGLLKLVHCQLNY